VRKLPAGAVVLLEPTRDEGDSVAATRALDGIWRVAMEQSDHLDIAAGFSRCAREDCDAVVRLSVDPSLGTISVTMDGEEGPRNLAVEVVQAGRLTDAVDRLAYVTRLALADPVASPPIAVAQAFGNDMDLIAQCEIAAEELGEGEFQAAVRRLQRIRRRDGGSPVLLGLLASGYLALGRTEQAEQTAQEALQMRARLTPTTTHRLLRALLLSRSSRAPSSADATEDPLMTLARTARRERPHDPEPRFTQALAANLNGDFRAARPLLEQLAKRLPMRSLVHYQLGWSCLGTDDPAAAAAALAVAARRLPLAATLMPRAVALYEASRHEDLTLLLDSALSDLTSNDQPAQHIVRRMQAAHAILQGDSERAGDILLSDLSWQLERPSRLLHRSGELAETGEVLVRIGRSRELQPLLFSMQTLGVDLAQDALFADAVNYLIGMAEAARQQRRMPQIEASLTRHGAEVWAQGLAAFGHRQLGELQAERAALGRCARESSSPLVKAALIANLREAGRTDEARILGDTLRQELLRIDLRRPLQHPVLAPESALAFTIR
jgi:tetratricopeptide (TPR) repeat protein